MRTVTKTITTAAVSTPTVIFIANTQEVYNWSYTWGVRGVAANAGTMSVGAMLTLTDGSVEVLDISASFEGDPTNTYGSTIVAPAFNTSRSFGGKVAATALRFEYTPTAGSPAAVIDFAFSGKNQ